MQTSEPLPARQSLPDGPQTLAARQGGGSLSPELFRPRARRWHPRAEAGLHSEIFASGEEGSGAALALALAREALRMARPSSAASANAPGAALGETGKAQDLRCVLWVQERRAIRLGGRPWLAGLPRDLRRRLIHVEAEDCKQALFALEEGLKCRDFVFVLGEIAGNPKPLDLTASRRLSLVAERHGVPLWLVRLDARVDLSSARMRWSVEAAPSLDARWNRDAPGSPTWRARLFRARRYPPGEWILHDGEGKLAACAADPSCGAARSVESDARRAPDSVDLAAPTVGRSLAAL